MKYGNRRNLPLHQLPALPSCRIMHMYALCPIVMGAAKALKPLHPTDKLQDSSEMSAVRPGSLSAGGPLHALG